MRWPARDSRQADRSSCSTQRLRPRLQALMRRAWSLATSSARLGWLAERGTDVDVARSERSHLPGGPIVRTMADDSIPTESWLLYEQVARLISAESEWAYDATTGAETAGKLCCENCDRHGPSASDPSVPGAPYIMTVDTFDLYWPDGTLDETLTLCAECFEMSFIRCRQCGLVYAAKRCCGSLCETCIKDHLDGCDCDGCGNERDNTVSLGE